MKRHTGSLPRGTVLLTSVLILSATLLAGMGGLLKWSQNGYRGAINRAQRTRMLYAAESGCQYAMASLQMFANAFETHPSSSDFARIITEFQAVAASNLPSDIRLAKYEFIEALPYMTNALADSLFRGMRASIKPVTVKVGIEQIADTASYVEVNQVIEARSFSIFEYSVFVDGDLMINSDKKMEITGAVHANGVLRLGTRAAADGLKITSFVTTASNLYNCSQPSRTVINSTPTTDHNMLDPIGQLLDSSHPYWRALALLTWKGRVMSREHGVPRLTLPIPYVSSNPRILIDPPQAGDNEEIATARYANRAAVRIMEDGAIQKYNAGSSNFSTIANISSVAWARTNKYFWNNALGYYVRPLDIDVGAFKTWVQANANTPFYTDAARAGILYVAVPTNRGSAVRLYNAGTLPNPVIGGVANGFTVATRNPLYLLSHYNNVSQCPACTLSDATTVLSSNWNDNEHLATNSPIGSCKNTSYLTAIVTGQCTNMNTFTGETWFGGIEDLPRYIEDWRGTGASGNKEIRGTIASLWPSKYELSNTVDPDKGPNRIWWYDPNFAYAPGAPRFHEFVPTQWRRVAQR